jgi:hypothetical protein
MKSVKMPERLTIKDFWRLFFPIQNGWAIRPTDLRAPKFLGQGGPKPIYVEQRNQEKEVRIER